MVNANAIAESFTGTDANGQKVRYSGTTTVITKDSCCCGNLEIAYCNLYRSFPSDTINEVINEKENYFVKYLEVGDQIDFCLTSDFDFMVKRIRFSGTEHIYFIENVVEATESEVVRVSGDGTICLKNGVIIIKPRYEYNIGDVVFYKTSLQEFPLGRDKRKH